MLLAWAELGGAEALAQRDALDARLCERTLGLDEGRDALPRIAKELREFGFSGTILEGEQGPRFVEFPCEERPLVERLVRHFGEGAGVGYLKHPLALALPKVQRRFGHSLEDCRVRVGVTRGHLLEVTFTVPFSLPGGDEDHAIAVEALLELVLGSDEYERWIGHVAVVRARRPGSLRVLSGPKNQSENYELSEGLRLIERAIFAISEELPPTLLGDEGGANWVALHLEPCTASSSATLHAERTFLATSQPEALKSALEGMPFSSRRFVCGEEIFFWISSLSKDLSREERVSFRTRVEKAIASVRQQTAALALIGSGFGPTRDYFDLVARPDVNVLGALSAAVAREGLPFRLGFYDSIWRSETLTVAP